MGKEWPRVMRMMSGVIGGECYGIGAGDSVAVAPLDSLTFVAVAREDGMTSRPFMARVRGFETLSGRVEVGSDGKPTGAVTFDLSATGDGLELLGILVDQRPPRGARLGGAGLD